MVQTTVNKYVIDWCLYNEIQYTGKFDMLTYFFGTNSVVVLSPDCTIELTQMGQTSGKYKAITLACIC